MAYNRFQYWVKGPRHKKLHKLVSIQHKINNGDFEWPSDVEKDFMNQQKSLEKKMQEFCKQRQGRNQHDVEMEMIQAFKKTRVTLLKVQEELYKEEEIRLEDFRDTLFNEYRGVKDKEAFWEQVLEDSFKKDCQSTMEFYLLFVEHWERLRKQN